MLQSTAEELQKSALELDYYAGVIPSYSGRGMMGKTTFALTLDDLNNLIPTVAHASVRIADSDKSWSEYMDDLANLTHDNLGQGIVVY